MGQEGVYSLLLRPQTEDSREGLTDGGIAAWGPGSHSPHVPTLRELTRQKELTHLDQQQRVSPGASLSSQRVRDCSNCLS